MYYADGRGNIPRMGHSAYAEKFPQFYAARKVLSINVVALRDGELSRDARIVEWEDLPGIYPRHARVLPP